MKKKALEDDIFNAVLEQAFTEAVAEEFADVPAAEVHSQVLPKNKRTKRKWIIYTGLLLAAGAVLLFLLMNAGSDGYSIETPEYVFGYIPDEYELTEYNDKGGILHLFRCTENDTYFRIYYNGIKDTTILIDNENSVTTQYDINGTAIYYTEYTISTSADLIWEDDIYLFNIYGTASKETLFKVAENIVRKPQ